MFDLKKKGYFKVELKVKPTQCHARFFWPDVHPWPPGVVQNSSEGKMYDNYYIFINGQTQTIQPGCLVLWDTKLYNTVAVLWPHELLDNDLIKEI